MTVSATGPATDDNTPPGDAPPEPGRPAQGIDRTVLGVAAAVTVLFVAWGIVATDNLASVTDTALDWVVRSFGWVFVLASTGFVVLSIWLALSRYGRIALGRDDDRAGVLDRLLGGDDVQRRHGHRPDVLGRRRADLAPRDPAAWPRARRHAGGRAAGDGVHALPLGAAPVGDLRRGRPGAGLLHLPQGPPQPDQQRLPPADRRSAPTGRSAGPSTSSRSSRRCSAPRPPSASAPLQINSGLNILWDVPTSRHALVIVIIAVLTVRVRAVGRHRRRARASSSCRNTNMVLAIVLRCSSCSSSARRSSSCKTVHRRRSAPTCTTSSR